MYFSCAWITAIHVPKMIKYNTIVIRTVFYAVYSPLHFPVIKFLYIIIPYSDPYAGLPWGARKRGFL